MEQRGIVLEQEEKSVIVLTPAGEFLRVPVVPPLPEVGTELSFTLPESKTKPGTGRWNRWFLAAAAVVFLFVLSSLAVFKPWLGQAVAYISVDINPSVELAINSEEKVIRARAFNTDGEKLLAGVNLVGVQAEKAVQILTDKSITDGYLTPAKENTVVITVVAEQDRLDRERLETKLKTSAEQYLKEKNLGATVSTIAVNKELRETSLKAGLSSGKGAILLESLAAGLSLTPGDLEKYGIAGAIKAAGGNPGEIIGKAHAEREFEVKLQQFRKQIEVYAKEANRAAQKDRKEAKEKDKEKEKKDKQGKWGKDDRDKDDRDRDKDDRNRDKDDRNDRERNGKNNDRDRDDRDGNEREKDNKDNKNGKDNKDKKDNKDDKDDQDNKDKNKNRGRGAGDDKDRDWGGSTEADNSLSGNKEKNKSIINWFWWRGDRD